MGKENKTTNSKSSLVRARGDFSLEPQLIHLNIMLTGSRPLKVQEAIERHAAALDRDPAGFIRQNIRDFSNRVAERAVEYLEIDTKAERASAYIAQSSSTTHGLALIYNGISVLPGQEILTTPHDFFSTKRALELRSRRKGTAVREVTLFENSRSATEKEILDNLEKAIRPRTRILALTWVHSNTGIKLPIGRIGRLVAEANRGRSRLERLIFCVDGVHGFGVEDVSFDDLQCDFFVAGCHKWLFGPRGTAIVCANPDNWQEVIETVPVLNPNRAAGGVLPYEHYWAVAEAFEFHLKLGKARIEKRTQRLAKRLKKGLDQLRRVSVVTPLRKKLSAGIVCCDIDGVGERRAVEDLRAKHQILASVSSEDIGGRRHVRFSPSILNTKKEIDRTIEAVAQL